LSASMMLRAICLFSSSDDISRSLLAPAFDV
jgi:hypothetical protein